MLIKLFKNNFMSYYFSKYKKLMTHFFISLTSIMVMITSSFIFLSSILLNTLYVHKPQNVREMFICFNGNDTWPDAWIRMFPVTVNGDSSLQVVKAEIPANTSSYKFRLIFNNNTWGDTKWSTICNLLTSVDPEYLSFKGLIYYIALAVTIVKLKIFTKILQRKLFPQPVQLQDD